jgi:HAD superfamily hydrolase (TIGR01490 family)
MATRGKQFAAFDIDGTLVRWQFFHAIVHELGVRGLIDANTHESIKAARMHWKEREHEESFRQYEKVLVRGYFDALKNINEDDHEAVIDAVFNQFRNQLFTFTRDLLRKCKKDGRLIFAISGSHESVLKKLADHLGIDDFIGATHEFKGGKYTGVEASPVHDKDGALRKLVEKHGATFKGSIAIGDSESDIAMLELVEQPIAFNPSRGLFAAAKKAGWDIVLERKNMVYKMEKRGKSYILAEAD